jgi:predicted permease
MFRLGCGTVTFICLLAATFVLWQAPDFPERLPSDLSDWAVAWFDLFRNPVAAAALVSLCVALAIAAASVTELLLGLIFSVLTAVISLLCLLGVLGAQYSGVADSVENLLK